MAKVSVAIVLLCSLWRSLAGTFPNIFCPSGSCLKRVKQGSNSNSFMCEYYTDEGYPCGWEGGTQSPGACYKCEGQTKYGQLPLNTAQNWNSYVTTSLVMNATNNYTLQCNNFAGSPYGAANPASGGKLCWCLPTALRPSKPSSVNQSSTAQCNMGSLVRPQCIISDIVIELFGFTFAQTKQQLHGTSPGLFSPTAQQTVFGDLGADPYYHTTRSVPVAYDSNTLTGTIVVPCSGINGEMDLDGCITAEDSFRGDPSLMYLPMRALISANTGTLGSIGNFANILKTAPAVTNAQMPAMLNASCVVLTTTTPSTPVQTSGAYTSIEMLMSFAFTAVAVNLLQ